MKKKLIIISTALILIFVIILIAVYKNNGNNVIKKDLLDILYEKIDNKEDIIIHITAKDDNCNFCTISKNMIDYYNKTFSLNMITLNKSSYSDKKFNNLLTKLGINLDSFIVAPALIIVDKGIAVTIINEIHDEVDLKKYLIEYGYIDNKYTENDIQVNDDKLEELYNSEDNSIVKLIDNFKYSVYIAGTVGSLMGNIKFIDEIKEEIELPYMVIVGNGKIIDYTTNKSNNKLEKFLQDNKFIE